MVERDVGQSSRDVGMVKRDVGRSSRDVGMIKQDVGQSSRDVGMVERDVGQSSRRHAKFYIIVIESEKIVDALELKVLEIQ